ncbi:uroporphyrinogen-III synthase [Asanoa siamensis]|uniref:Uroporphyrinogen-III synthase n=1 Tax=Asanoa siamensis TaxID=926357 RepID=A0ABQ4CX30_9ACTN|nr:uroporphyrinogen-III synthase [Asanoa siamensis]GIF75839.1 uroporphyrinogen-III synthase [Asanoa siamensis]
MTQPLRGFTVATTAERRRDELGALLERRGARVLSVPAITIVPLLDDAALHAATAACVAHAPDIVVATTGIGFRGWLEAAEGWGVGEALRGGLRGARLIARGAKPCGAIRAAGLTEDWSAPTESCAEILDRLLAEGVSGRRIAVQLHGGPQDEFTGALRAAGAAVVEVPVYRWTRRADMEPLRRLVDQIVTGQVDAVTFTSAPAVIALLDTAGDRAADVLAAFGDRVLAACVGPVTAAPLLDRGVPALTPERSRLGALVRAVTDTLPTRARRLSVGGVTVEVRGHAAVVDGEVRPLAPASMALLRALAAQPGAVVPRALLATALPRGERGHAIDMAVARLRASLGADLVETVIKRGYRLRVPA